MLLNRSHTGWVWFTVLATAASGLLYLGAFRPELVPWLHLPDWLARTRSQHTSVGNSTLGLIYGTVSYAIFIFAVLLNTRKKLPAARLGRVQSWLRAHIWLTILTLPLVFMHAAFRFGGVMTSSLMWLYLLVMVSGFYGLALQQYLPRQMKRQLTLETIYDEIPFLTQQNLGAALRVREELRPAAVADEVLANAARSDSSIMLLAPDASLSTVREALEHEVLPYLAAKRPTKHRLAEAGRSEDYFRTLRLRVAPEQHGWVDQFAMWCEERRQMLLQERYHRLMQGWLIVHVPASFLLIIVTGWHAVVTLLLY